VKLPHVWTHSLREPARVLDLDCLLRILLAPDLTGCLTHCCGSRTEPCARAALSTLGVRQTHLPQPVSSFNRSITVSAAKLK
jgi:hypothetical protein